MAYVHVNGKPIKIGFAPIQNILNVCKNKTQNDFKVRIEALVRNKIENRFGDPTQENYTWPDQFEHKNVRFCQSLKEKLTTETWEDLPLMEDILIKASAGRILHFKVE